MINKLTNLLEIKCPHNHDAAAHKSEKNIISNTIKCKAEILEFSSHLQESHTFKRNYFQTVIDNDEEAVIWGSEQMINNLRNSLDVQFDATFKVVPKLFINYSPFSLTLKITLFQRCMF
eukprot:TRINITY_DN2941_c0_g1_i2.p1 TRINITY_DN2941_c0_g1~~TRINITY_DN2941_c0_g1_i2.p1  ORF type:complete len:119 (-),score=7.62 TRINITY_DN2941_c0_g1_i2:6-362(-)